MTNEAVCLSLVHTDNEPPQRSPLLLPFAPSSTLESRISRYFIAPLSSPLPPSFLLVSPRLYPTKLRTLNTPGLPLILEDVVPSN